MRQPPSLSLTRSYRPGAPGRACQSMTSSPPPGCLEASRLFPVVVLSIESCTMFRNVELKRLICKSTVERMCVLVRSVRSVRSVRGAVVRPRSFPSCRTRHAPMCISMTSTVRRSKVQRVSRFDATARTQIDSASGPRIDVEPAGPLRAHRLDDVGATPSHPVDTRAETNRGDEATPDVVEGAWSASVEPCHAGTLRRASAAAAPRESLGNRLLATIAWSLLLWVPVCVWLAVQVRI